MSNVCCKEFTGWFKSFTKLERALAVLEAILLVVLFVLLILLILHLIVCSKPDYRADSIQNQTTIIHEGYIDGTFTYKPVNDSEPSQTTKSNHNEKPVPKGSYTFSEATSGDKDDKFTEAGIKCSWTPSAKTTAAVHYYEDGVTDDSNMNMKSPKLNESTTHTSTFNGSTTVVVVEREPDSTTTQVSNLEDLILSDSEEAEDEHKSYVVALVKFKPPKDVIFGCILTIVSKYWTLTAASCIEAIEEIDSLDSFIIMEQYGTNKKGPLQTVDDVLIHPLYEGKNKSYDLAALKSVGSLIKGTGSPVELATFLDYALGSLAERFTILGYGAFRSIDRGPSGRGLRQAQVYRLPARQCAAAEAEGSAAALRHLEGGRAVGRGACGAAPLCAGVLFSRGLPCNYCSGAPLLRGAVLLGVMADNRHCGVACEPQLYVNIADAADWIRATIRREFIN